MRQDCSGRESAKYYGVGSTLQKEVISLTERMATLTVAFGLVIVFATAHPVLDPDMWWHLAVGDAILQHRSVYFVDPLSFTNPKVWVNSQWLTEAVFAAIYRRVGVVGLEVLALVLKVATFLLVFKAMNAPPLTKVWVTVLFAFGALPLIGGVRPQLLSFLFLAWLTLTIHRYRQKPEMCVQGAECEVQNHGEVKTNLSLRTIFRTSHTAPCTFPLLFALWSNAHSFYPIAFALILLAILADYLNERKGVRDEGRGTMTEQRPVLGSVWRRQMALALILSAVAVMVTPFGWHSLKQVLVNIVQSSQLPIEEWKPAIAMRHPLVLIWAFLLLLWLFCLAWSPKRPDALELLWGAFATLSALTGVRMIVLWCIVLAPFVGEHLGQWISQIAQETSERRQPPVPVWLPSVTLTLIAFLAGLILALRFNPSEFIKRERKEYPQRAVAWLKGAGLRGNCLTRYDWGGYVAWQLKGQVKVFVDGRADFYPPKVMNDFITAYFGKANWRNVLDRYGVTMVIAPPDAPISNLLSMHASGWRCVYRDKGAVVFIRRILATSQPNQPAKPQKANGQTELMLPLTSAVQ